MTGLGIVCVCVCMCVCGDVCVCVCACVCACVCVHMYVLCGQRGQEYHRNPWMYLCITFGDVCVCIHMYVCCVEKGVKSIVVIFGCTYVLLLVMCVCTCVCVCVCVWCMYRYVFHTLSHLLWSFTALSVGGNPLRSFLAVPQA